ncbi:uncharacterized protein LY79DRAFT_358519 [Colletotrichum navitas]|uniref:Uncharacterized protein n=1 Tax=Colletotrichum navitas TaxID=681940 RepID=A0AAD8PS05_9PEZI|nr:uncharacterized protein LY79DRAFT_358519 [Colletotrichum navitas]KAK1574731.1 hypothetical protein LY79DRAFT_358519 [Colletotrichum navitas]
MLFTDYYTLRLPLSGIRCQMSTATVGLPLPGVPGSRDGGCLETSTWNLGTPKPHLQVLWTWLKLQTRLSLRLVMGKDLAAAQASSASFVHFPSPCLTFSHFSNSAQRELHKILRRNRGRQRHKRIRNTYRNPVSAVISALCEWERRCDKKQPPYFKRNADGEPPNDPPFRSNDFSPDQTRSAVRACRRAVQARRPPLGLSATSLSCLDMLGCPGHPRDDCCSLLPGLYGVR